MSQIRYFVNTRIAGYAFETNTYLKHLFLEKHPPSTKFIIFGSGRSGSTLLVSMLNAHPSVHCEGEILKRTLLSPRRYIENRSQLSPHQLYGFKLLSYHLRDIQSTVKDKQQFIEKLVKDGYKIIYLNRENLLRQSLSVFYAYHRNEWHQTKETSHETSKMNVDMSQLESALGELVELKNFEKRLIEHIPHLYINYEADLEDNSKHTLTFEKVADFLGIDALTPSTKLVKITPKRLSGFIQNAEEMVKHLQQTPYAKYLEV